MTTRRIVPPSGLVLALLVMAGAVGVALNHGPALARVPLGLAAVLYVPGFVATAALFPEPMDLSRVERIAASIGLSLVIVVLVALALNYTPGGVTFQPIVFALAVVTVVGGTVGWARATRAHRRPLQERFRPTARTALLIALVIGLLAAAAAALVVTLAPAPARFTELYALGEEGHTDTYPTAAREGQPVSLTVGLTSHEAAAATYHLVLRSGSADLLTTPEFEIAPGANWQQSLSFQPPATPGLQTVDVQLYRAGDSSPYRHLEIPIEVSA